MTEEVLGGQVALADLEALGGQAALADLADQEVTRTQLGAEVYHRSLRAHTERKRGLL